MAVNAAERELQRINVTMSEHGFSDTDDVPLSAIVQSAMVTLKHQLAASAAALHALEARIEKLAVDLDTVAQAGWDTAKLSPDEIDTWRQAAAAVCALLPTPEKA